jgi:pimeloyl-ACP methyl ester carboxylesterase
MTLHRPNHPRRAHVLTVLAAIAAVGTIALTQLTPASATQRAPQGKTAQKPTIVLEHGAFADASSWSAVTRLLQKQGYTVIAPANPLEGLPTDTAYLKAVLKTIKGPVVLVGHSYGGAVITDASTGDPNVRALAYIAAYALAQGESVSQANALCGAKPPLLASHLVLLPISKTQIDAYIDPAWFRRVFAADLPAAQARVMAAEQRPAALGALSDPSTAPGWKTIPSWYLVARNDNAIPPVAEKCMAARAHAHTIEINSSHVAMLSHPSVVTKLIISAAKAR